MVMNKTKALRLLVAAVLLQLQVNAFVLKPNNRIQPQKGSTDFSQKKSPLFSSVNYDDAFDGAKTDDRLGWIKRGGEIAQQSPKKSLVQFYNWYLASIESKPILTKAVTAAVVNFLGDVLAQFLEASSSGAVFVPNWIRLQGFFLCGLIYTGPYVHTWYEQLWKIGRWMEEKYNSPKQLQSLVQLIVDQTVGVAIFFSTYFYVYEIIDALVCHRMPVMSAATAKITENISSVLLTSYYIWPLTNWISFNYVPVQLRVLLNNVVGVLWNAFLCSRLAG